MRLQRANRRLRAHGSAGVVRRVVAEQRQAGVDVDEPPLLHRVRERHLGFDGPSVGPEVDEVPGIVPDPLGPRPSGSRPRCGRRGAFASCCGVIAGAPASSTERRNRMSESPERSTRWACSATSPVACAHEYGSATSPCAVRPNRLKLSATPTDGVNTSAWTCSTGRVGSVSTPPLEKLVPAMREREADRDPGVGSRIQILCDRGRRNQEQPERAGREADVQHGFTAFTCRRAHGVLTRRKPT